MLAPELKFPIYNNVDIFGEVIVGEDNLVPNTNLIKGVFANGFAL